MAIYDPITNSVLDAPAGTAEPRRVPTTEWAWLLVVTPLVLAGVVPAAAAALAQRSLDGQTLLAGYAEPMAVAWAALAVLTAALAAADAVWLRRQGWRVAGRWVLPGVLLGPSLYLLGRARQSGQPTLNRRSPLASVLSLVLLIVSLVVGVAVAGATIARSRGYYEHAVVDVLAADPNMPVPVSQVRCPTAPAIHGTPLQCTFVDGHGATATAQVAVLPFSQVYVTWTQAGAAPRTAGKASTGTAASATSPVPPAQVTWPPVNRGDPIQHCFAASFDPGMTRAWVDGEWRNAGRWVRDDGAPCQRDNLRPWAVTLTVDVVGDVRLQVSGMVVGVTIIDSAHAGGNADTSDDPGATTGTDDQQPVPVPDGGGSDAGVEAPPQQLVPVPSFFGLKHPGEIMAAGSRAGLTASPRFDSTDPSMKAEALGLCFVSGQQPAAGSMVAPHTTVWVTLTCPQGGYDMPAPPAPWTG